MLTLQPLLISKKESKGNPDPVVAYRAILRYYRCDTPYHAIHFPGVKHLDPLRHIYAIPYFAKYLAMIVQYPINASMHFGILSLQASRDMKVSLLGLSPKKQGPAAKVFLSTEPLKSWKNKEKRTKKQGNHCKEMQESKG